MQHRKSYEKLNICYNTVITGDKSDSSELHKSQIELYPFPWNPIFSSLNTTTNLDFMVVEDDRGTNGEKHI